MKDKEILDRWRKEKLNYEAWGKFVTQKIDAKLRDVIIAPDSVDNFLNLPVKPRIKSDSSLLDKALYRGKCYSALMKTYPTKLEFGM
jgi:hypothetical protein